MRSPSSCRSCSPFGTRISPMLRPQSSLDVKGDSEGLPSASATNDAAENDKTNAIHNESTRAMMINGIEISGKILKGYLKARLHFKSLTMARIFTILHL